MAAVSNNVAAGSYTGPVTLVVTTNIAGISGLNLTVAALGSTNADEQGFRIEAIATADNAGATVGRSEVALRIKDRPITRYELYHEVDLELYPWHDWDVTGPVYCSSNAYFRPTTGDTLTFQQDVRVTGNIVIGSRPLEPPAPDPPGTVVYQSESLANARPPMRPPAPAGENNGRHWVLERPATSDYGTPTGNERFCNKADVIMLVSNTVVQVLQGPKHGGGLITNGVPPWANTTNACFEDDREGLMVGITRINGAGVNSWVNTVFGGAAPAHPIVYVADERTTRPLYGIMITNAATLPTSGFTLATPNPIYLHGDFNLNTPQPALLAGDAITILSSAWVTGTDNDGNSSNDAGDGGVAIDSSNRDAVNTTVNASLVTGIVFGPNGTGWVANVLRLLEDWRLPEPRRTLTFNGSLAVLYLSEKADGVWDCCYYYEAPTRTFGFTDYTDQFPSGVRTNLLSFKLAIRNDYR
jgi:hypothetical protein